MPKLDPHIIALEAIKDILEPLKNALDDDGLESYADELYIALERLDAIVYVLKNRSLTPKEGVEV